MCPSLTITYKITRLYFNDDVDHETIRTGLTLQEALEWCNDPETSSSTATNPVAARRTLQFGPWFDGYSEERE